MKKNNKHNTKFRMVQKQPYSDNKTLSIVWLDKPASHHTSEGHNLVSTGEYRRQYVEISIDEKSGKKQSRTYHEMKIGSSLWVKSASQNYTRRRAG